MAIGDTRRVRRLAMGVAAVGVATSVVGLAATQPASVSSTLVDLNALIVVGSSTNPSGAGVENFYGGKFTDPIYTGPNGDDIVFVNFASGPWGIQQALEANAGERNAVVASGWGAANLGLLALVGDQLLANTVLVMDNDVARPDGGFGTRYPWFALIGVNPFPTPSETPAAATVNTGYEYDYNSNAPADVLNPFAAVNALAAYLTVRLNQADVDLPVDVDGRPTVSCSANTCAITESGAVLDCADARCASPGDRITAYVTTRNNTTYVTYTVAELPLTGLIRKVLGDRIADITAPLLKLAVDSAYDEANPIPRDPSAYRPARLFPSVSDVLATAVKLPGAIQQTLEAIGSPSHSKKSTESTEITALDLDSESVKPQRNVVRESLKATPGLVADNSATTKSETPEPEPLSTPAEISAPAAPETTPAADPSEPADSDESAAA